MNVGIVGISGYTGIELTRLLGAHPTLKLVMGAGATSAGRELSAVWPALDGVIDLTIDPVNPERLIDRCDVVFLAMPHGHAARLAPSLVAGGVTVVDLGADFR
ncbi:MAG: N-acetyl-gamma-glutamyl-phosphate reductase, partial [Myxococcota bacterium]|nr:N-acetyl-gamma-glutamyl-phosphate reductase [Myxococcota bacterium]